MKRAMMVAMAAVVGAGAVLAGAQTNAPAAPPAAAAPAAAVAAPPAAVAAPVSVTKMLGEGRGQLILSWDEFVNITGYDPSRKGSQVVTIPWAEVENLLGVKVDQVGKAAMVDLPWNEFKALLEWSIKRKEADDTPPPTDFIVTSCQYAGELAAESASFTLTARLNIIRKKGWKRIPLLPAGVALTKTTLPEGVFLNVSGAAYELLTDKTGPMDVTVQFSVSVTRSGGIDQVNFPRVLTGSSLLDLTVARENVEVKVPPAQSVVSKSAAGKTQVAAALPSGAAVTISWERALPKVEAAAAKLYAETRTLIAVAEGMFLCQEAVNYNILHSGVRELSLQAPAAASVLTITGTNVQDWRADKEGKIQVVLSGEAIGSLILRITYEAPTQAAGDVPVIHPLGVERERGFVGVVAVANVEVSAGQVAEAAAIDARQLPPDIVAMTNQPILLAFRYLGGKCGIQLAIKRHDEVGVLMTIADSAAFTAMQLPDGRRITRAIYSVRNNRNQFLRLQMPAGADIWSVSVGGNAVSPARDEQASTLIPLIRSAGGSQELAAFPVEIAYVEAPKAPAPERGTVHVDLPICAAPALHVMYSYYVPAEGKYTVGWGDSGFSGPLAVVKEFTSLVARAGREVVKVDAAGQAQKLQKEFDARVDAEALAAGATPIRVSLPLNGILFKLEKVLVMPGDKLYLDLRYSGWKAAR